jgi:hypothetical protein
MNARYHLLHEVIPDEVSLVFSQYRHAQLQRLDIPERYIVRSFISTYPPTFVIGATGFNSQTAQGKRSV